jgi:hypothetical protein
MQMNKGVFVVLLAFSSGIVAACSVHDEREREPTSVRIGRAQQAQDDETHPDDGKTCVVEGPDATDHHYKKGKMSGGSCCFRDDSGLTCYNCEYAPNQCEVAGGDVGVRIPGTEPPKGSDVVTIHPPEPPRSDPPPDTVKP